MRPSRTQHAFTLAEMMISMAGSSLILGALLFSSVQLQKSLRTAERYSDNQADQRRLLDSVARDLRRAIGIASTTAPSGEPRTRFSGAAIDVENGAALVVSLPGYYRSHDEASPDYVKPMDVEAVDNYVDYGIDGRHAAPVSVIFRKEYAPSEECVCFIRIEEGTRTILVRKADDLHLHVEIGADGRTCTIETTYDSPRRSVDGRIHVRDQILLRNLRLD